MCQTCLQACSSAPPARAAIARSSARAALACLIVVGLAFPTARAGGNDDHERVRAAVRAGEVLALPSVLERLQRSHPGQVLELELEREDGRWIYEVKLLQGDGTLLELELDARTAEVLESRRKDAGKGSGSGAERR